jgi:putative ABC transport system permease protein
VPTLTIDDAESLNSLPSVAAAAPVLQGFFQVLYGDDNSNSTVLGTTPEIFAVRSWVMDRGVPISDTTCARPTASSSSARRIAAAALLQARPAGPGAAHRRAGPSP